MGEEGGGSVGTPLSLGFRMSCQSAGGDVVKGPTTSQKPNSYRSGRWKQNLVTQKQIKWCKILQACVIIINNNNIIIYNKSNKKIIAGIL